LGGNEMPKNFNHRGEEIKEIVKYIENCLTNKNKNKYKILMVTGSPGAGKTLSVSHILTKLEK
jgi:Cdc6-like AAA superfamily ATPase